MSTKDENIIIHTTKSFDDLKKILTGKSLRLSFSSEIFSCKGKTISAAAHPMICFSEYNLKSIHKEIITYGRYAVGFSKRWARKNEIGPVLYVSDNSVAAIGMKKMLEGRRRKDGQNRIPPKIRLAIMELKCFIKNEIGYNSHTGDPNFDFKAENEWRYVPQKNKIRNYLISQNKRSYEKNKKKHNEMLLPFWLSFKLSDIEVIYVSSVEEKHTLESNGIHPGLIKISKWKVK